MTSYHALVWIDRDEAKIFGIGPEENDRSKIDGRSLRHHIHADSAGQSTIPPDANFLHEVAGALAAARAILIAGPGRAKTELAGFLKEQYPLIGRRIWRVESLDRTSGGEMVVAARRYFRAEDRVHQ